MSFEQVIRLLIVEEGQHQADQLTSALRAQGLHVLAEFAEDDEDLQQALESKPLDLVLINADREEFGILQAMQLIRNHGKRLPLIGLTESVTPDAVADAMKLGAQDLVQREPIEWLTRVLQREAENIHTWRRAMEEEKALHESEKRCQALLANSRDAVAYVHEGLHIYANDSYLELLGKPDFESIEGIPLIDMAESAEKDRIKHFLRQFSQGINEGNELEVRLLHDNGEPIKAVLEFTHASYEGEPCTQILIRAQSDTAELEEQINYLHQHDLVTGLYNRQHFMDALQQKLDQAHNGQGNSVLLYVSIDNFQHVRETVGISGCDILINDIAEILNRNAGKDELVARFGAYSYTLLLPGTPGGEIDAHCKKILQQVESHISEIGTRSISPTVSISILGIDEHAPNNPNELIARSERNLDRIQAEGGNAARVYAPVAGEMTQEEEDAEITRQIKKAIADNLLVALYQPIVSIAGAPGERYEITRQIRTEEGKTLTEAEFMPAAERSGTARTLDRWSVISAIRQIAVATKSARKLEIFIPLSSDSLQDAGFARWVAARVQSAKIPGEQLIFMLNEEYAVNQLKAAKNLFKALKQLHCQVVLDGFGIGVNPFQLVKHMQPDYLRISEDFTDGLSGNPENQNSIREIAQQASSMEIRCIIPGVTDASVLSALWTVGADFVQGDFLQAPAEALSYDFTSMAG